MAAPIDLRKWATIFLSDAKSGDRKFTLLREYVQCIGTSKTGNPVGITEEIYDLWNYGRKRLSKIGYNPRQRRNTRSYFLFSPCSESSVNASAAHSVPPSRDVNRRITASVSFRKSSIIPVNGAIPVHKIFIYLVLRG